jgi:hypothetical protein
LACDVLQRCSFYQEEGLSQEIRKWSSHLKMWWGYC